MMKQKLIIILMLVFLVGTICILLTIDDHSNLTEENTTLVFATVKNVQYSGHAKEKSITITAEEFNGQLIILSHIPDETLDAVYQSIHVGDTVNVRVNNSDLQNINNDTIIEIVSILKEKDIIISLADYNLYLQEAACVPRLICFVLIALLFIAILILTSREIRIFRVKSKRRC